MNQPTGNRFGPSLLTILVLSLMLAPLAAAAHQPQAVGTAAETAVVDPEISKAYYGQMTGQPVGYEIHSTVPFHLYVNILVPDARGAANRPKVEVFRGNGQSLALLDSGSGEWKRFHEPFAGDDYLQGPEYQADVPAGEYRLRVSSPDNVGKYVLAVGQAEKFTVSETWNALRLIPKLKSDFFLVPRWTFLFSVFGGVSFGLALVLGVLIGLLFRWVLRVLAWVFHPRTAIGSAGETRAVTGTVPEAPPVPPQVSAASEPPTPADSTATETRSAAPSAGARLFGAVSTAFGRRAHRNIDWRDRLIRLGLGLVFLVIGLFAWSLAAFVLTGFLFYEASVGWCALNALLGRSTCPIA